jgi:broad specificity phosphatase PhoE
VEGDWKGVFAGSRVDMGLSPAGHAQAGALADWLGGRKIDAVFSSPMLRVRPCVEQILATPGYASAAVFCHGGIVRAMLAILMDLSFTKIGSFRMDYGSVTVVEVPVENPRAVEIGLLNFCPPAGLRER